MTSTASLPHRRTDGPVLAGLLARASGVLSLRAAFGWLIGAVPVCRSRPTPPTSERSTGAPAARLRFRGLFASALASVAALVIATSAEAYPTNVRINLEEDGDIRVRANYRCWYNEWKVFLKPASVNEFTSSHEVHQETGDISNPPTGSVSHTIENPPDEDQVDVKMSMRSRSPDALGGCPAASNIRWHDSDVTTITLKLTFGGATFADQDFALNQAVDGLELPAAAARSNSDQTPTYALSPALPAGLSFDTATRTISGTPTATSTSAVYTLKATDEHGDEASLTFKIGVTERPYFDKSVADQSWAQNRPIRLLQLPEATGGNGTLTYTLAPPLPDGLSFDDTTLQISGTPTAATQSEATTYTFTAKDTDGDEGTLTFGATVETDTRPGFGNQTVGTQLWVKDVEIEALQLPESETGNPEFVYTLTPALPEGLSFDAATRKITGTPTELKSRTIYTYKVTDADNDEATETFSVTVEADTEPDFGTSTFADLVLTENILLGVQQLPAATGGNGTLTYSITPELSAGLSFDAALRQISGTPTELKDSTTYTYKAVDIDGDETTLTFSITVEANTTPSFGDKTIADQDFAQNKAIRTLQLPEATGGNGTLTYSLPNGLLSGLNFDASTRQITGMPDRLDSTGILITYRVTDEQGDTADLTFTIRVSADTAPSFDANASIADQGLKENATVQAVSLPVATGGNPDLIYSISPDLPAGLSFDAAARTITGTPTEPQQAANYTYTVTDADGDVDTLTFSITVDEDLMPSFGDKTVADQVYRTNEAIEALQLPDATGGDGTLTYTLTPDSFPDGLSFDASARQITGTPTTIGPAVEYSWKAEDSDGDAATLTFTIEVTAAEKERRSLTDMLAASAQATLSSAVDVIGYRFDATPGGSALTLAGRQVGGAASAVDDDLWNRLDRRDDRLTAASYSVDRSSLLRDSAFALPLAASGGETDGPGWTLWGRGDWRQFEGRNDGGSWDGAQRTAWLGVDTRRGPRLTAGLALSQGESDAEYRLDQAGGRLETSLTALWPYVQVTDDNGATWRVVLGAGTGDAEHRTSRGDTEKADLSLLAGSVSGRLPVARSGSVSVSVIGGASLAQIETDGASTTSIGGLTAKRWQLRGGLEAERDGVEFSAESDWLVRPRGAVALRQDGGDGVSGAGMEVSGGVRLSAPDSRFGLDASGHWLALHSQNDTQEWGASVEARLSPEADGRGLSLSFGPTLGQRHGELTRERLFERERPEDTPQRLSLTLRAGYGFAAVGGLLTPFADLEYSGESSAQRYRTGIDYARSGVNAALTAGHREGAEADTRIGLDLRLRY